MNKNSAALMCELVTDSGSSLVKSRRSFGLTLLLLRKEVIQPHLPVRLPCYDLVPVTDHTFVDALLAVRQTYFGCNQLR